MDFNIDDLVGDYASGVSLYQLTKKYPISDHFARKAIKATGLKIRNRTEALRAKSPRPENLSEIVRRHEAGENMDDIAEEFGVTRSGVRHWFAQAGIRLSPQSRRIKLPIDDIVEEYRAGESVKALAEKYGVSRSVITRRLSDREIPIRGASAATVLQWKKWKKEGRTEEIVSSAHAAVRGRTMPMRQKVRLAQSKRMNAKLGEHEQELADLLHGRGLNPIQQFPCGPYNFDMALNESGLAVEVLGRPLNKKARAIFRKRCEHVFSDGWSLLYVKCFPESRLDLPAITDKIVAIRKSAGRNKPGRGQYWVVGSDGQLAAGGRGDLDGLASIIATHPC